MGGATPAVVIAQKPAEKPAAAAPKPAAEKAKPAAEKPAADAGGEVIAAVRAWAQAWSKKDADAYLAHYAKDFKTPGGQSRTDWEKSRRSRIAAPKSISVEVGSPKVTMQGPERASVAFRQTYRSDVFKGTNSKTLIMSKSEGRWLIEEEKGN